jgi:hypothetical protein
MWLEKYYNLWVYISIVVFVFLLFFSWQFHRILMWISWSCGQTTLNERNNILKSWKSDLMYLDPKVTLYLKTKGIGKKFESGDNK